MTDIVIVTEPEEIVVVIPANPDPVVIAHAEIVGDIDGGNARAVFSADLVIDGGTA